MLEAERRANRAVQSPAVQAEPMKRRVADLARARPSWQSILARLPHSLTERAGGIVHSSPRLRSLLHRTVLKRVQYEDVTIAKGPAQGLRFNASGGPARYALGDIEPEVQELLQRELRPGDVLYDLGASIGFFTVLGAKLVGPEGRIVAVEPFPESARRLRRNVELNGFATVTVEQAAVAAEPGESTFVGGDELVWGWLEQVDQAPAGGMAVRVLTIDSLVADGAPAPSLIKLDIEGAEVLALKGAGETLRDHRPVVMCETHGTRAEVVALLEQHDYVVTALDGGPLAPLPAKLEPMGEGWFDHVLARPRQRPVAA
jgi:FkbM family methyltransferase